MKAIGKINSSGELEKYSSPSSDPNKMDLVNNATNGNVAQFNSNGGVVDSQIAVSDLMTKVTGGTTDDLVKLDSNGKIADAGKKVSDLAEKDDISSLIETGATASQAISSGTYFYLNGALVRAKTAIASGATFTENTNYESVTVGGELNSRTIYTASSNKTFSAQLTEIAPYFNALSEEERQRAYLVTGVTKLDVSRFDSQAMFHNIGGSTTLLNIFCARLNGAYVYASINDSGQVTFTNGSSETNTNTLILKVR